MTEKIKIVFIGDVSSNFIKNDYEILATYFDVAIIKPPGKKSGWLKFLLSLAEKVKKSDVSFSWFAGWHSAIAVFFSKLFKKNSIVVVGGYDAVNIPQINYGAFSNFKEKIAALYVYKNVDKILVVESSLKNDIIRNAKIKEDNINYIPTCYDVNYWVPKGEKENIVLTVAAANDLKRIKLKGLDTFVKSAKYLQDIKFIVIGVKDKAKTYLEQLSPKNVKLIELLSSKELLRYYQMAKVYCQLSLSEGLPNALCEAMLCECIPIGSRIEGIKTAIGDTGFYVEYGDEKTTVAMIKKALFSEDDLGKKARERIKTLFPDKTRREKLEQLVRDMTR